MDFSLFSIKNKWFLGYSLAVLVLGGRLLWFQIWPSNLPVLVDFAWSDQGSAIHLTERICSRSNSEINKNADIYKYPVNEGVRANAKVLDSLFNKFQAFDISKSRKPAEVGHFLDDLDILLTRIAGIVEQDSMANAAFLTIFPEKSIGSERRKLANFMENAEYDPALVCYHSIIWRAKIAQYYGLKGLENQIKHLDLVRFESFLPVISADLTHFEKTGKIEGDIFLTAYSSTAKNLSYKIDGQDVPNNNGIGHWSKVYDTPGRRKLEVQCFVKNPLTGELRNYSKEFSLTINP